MLERWNEISAETVTVIGLKQKFMDILTNEAMWSNLIVKIIYILIILAAGRLFIKLANKTIAHIILERDEKPGKINRLKFDHRRVKTIGKLIHNVLSYTVNFIILLSILAIIGAPIGPLLASAGVLGLAIGFGAQSLVKDVITGFFIIFEDQFAVGDVIQTSKYKGTVEEIGLRITRIKSWTGEIHIIPNGSIADLTNFSVNNSVAVVDFPIASGAPVEAVIETIQALVAKLYNNSDMMINEPEVLGVQSRTIAETVIRVVAECQMNTEAKVSRLLNTEIEMALEAKGINRAGKAV